MSSNETIRETESSGAKTVREDGLRNTEKSQETMREDSTSKSQETMREGASSVSDAISLQKFRDYSIVKRLKTSGAESDVYIVSKGSDEFVLKLYRYGIEPKTELIRKIVNLSKGSPKELVQVYEFDYDAGSERWYEIQEYIQHGTLKELIDDIPKTDEKERNNIFLDILRQVSDGLKVLHENGIIHRDLKPANILLRSLNPIDLVITDFGISSIIASDQSKKETKRAGTAMYQSPESWTEIIGKPADWWSLGMMAIEIANGGHPFDGVTGQNIQNLVVTKPIGIPETISPDNRKLLRGLLTRDPSKRWSYDQVSRLLNGQFSRLPNGEPDIPDYFEAAVVVANNLRPLKFMGEEHSSLETIARAIMADEATWAEGLERLMRGSIRTWLDSNGESDQAAEVEKLIEDGQDPDEKLFRFVHRYGKPKQGEPLPFVFMGKAITFNNLHLFLGRKLRREEQPKSEAVIAEKLFDGRISALLDFYLQHNETNEELDGLKWMFSYIQGKSQQAVFDFLNTIHKDEIVPWFIERLKEKIEQLHKNPPTPLKKSATVSMSDSFLRDIDKLRNRKILNEAEIQARLNFDNTYTSSLAVLDEVKREFEYPGFSQYYQKALRFVAFCKKSDYNGYIKSIHEETERLRQEETRHEEESKRQVQNCYERYVADALKSLQGEEERKAPERLAAMRKQRQLKMISTALAAIIIINASYFAISNYRNSPLYAQAETALLRGDYETAIKNFQELGNFRDARTKLLEAIYAQAEAALSKGDYGAAINSFQTLGNFRDARERSISIPFGGYEWRVLDVQGNKALIITKNVIERRAYNEQNISVTWETCTLRKYLNGEFYAKFTKEEQERIAETRISNPANPWYGIKGGNDTSDTIFLLNLEEVVKYFGDSGQLRNGPIDKNKIWINDRYNSERITKDTNGKVSRWWLRSTGANRDGAAGVYDDGGVDVYGSLVDVDYGLRPALWLNL